MRIVGIFAAGCLAASVMVTEVAASDLQARLKESGFSYIPPAGWRVREMPGLKYRVTHGTTLDGFAPNVVFSDEAFTGTVAAYVEQTVANLSKAAEAFRLVEQSAFVTESGIDAVRIVIESTQRGRPLRQTLFVFARPKRFLIVTYSRPAAKGAENDALVQASMRSVRFESE